MNEDFSFNPNEFPEKNEALWREEESIGDYDLPVLASVASLRDGQQIAKLDPPEQDTELIGSFVVSHSPESHRSASLQSLDFLVPDGTPVLAAAGGRVIDVVIDNTKWGTTEEYAQFLNYIVIQHPDGEYSQYCHLAASSLADGLGVGSEV
jgi:murein DD-endopeptidase MepM/ murein hydrolase activator NlpD